MLPVILSKFLTGRVNFYWQYFLEEKEATSKEKEQTETYILKTFPLHFWKYKNL